MRWIRVLMCAVVATAACALPGSSQPPPSAAQVLGTRLAAFAAARSVTMVGHVSLADVTYRVSLQLDDRGQASGSVTLDQYLAATVLTGGHVFLKSAEYYSAHQLATGGQWVLERDGMVLAVLTKLASRKELAAALLGAAGSGVQQGQTSDVAGSSAIKLATADLSVTVPAASGPPVRVVTGVDTKLSDGLSDVQLDLSDYGKAVSIAAPAAYLDRAQPDTWPVYYSAVIGPDTPFSYDGCDRSGCTLTASFKNYGGKVGTATATFYVSRAGTFVASCDVPIPGSSNGGIVRAGCRINFNDSTPVDGNVKVRNPQ